MSQGTLEDAQTSLVGRETEQPLEETLDNMSEGFENGHPVSPGILFQECHHLITAISNA